LLRSDLAGFLRFMGPIRLNAMNHVPKPILNGFLQFRLRVLAFHAIDGLPVLIQRNMVAGDVFVAATGWDKVRQQALAAGMRSCRIVKIDAGE
jgi:hypothetical protein